MGWLMDAVRRGDLGPNISVASDIPSVPRRECSQCFVRRPFSSFGQSNRRMRSNDPPGVKLKTACRKCCNSQLRGWRSRNAEAVGKSLRRGRFVFKGILEEDYLKLLENQGGVCAICKQRPSIEKHFSFAIDHDHNHCPGGRACGQCVRGILCRSCNAGLGCFKDNPGIIIQAAEYLLENGLLWGGSLKTKE